jgi:hypothetical protein
VLFVIEGGPVHIDEATGQVLVHLGLRDSRSHRLNTASRRPAPGLEAALLLIFGMHPHAPEKRRG